MKKIIIEPFKIKSVEPISINNKIEREKNIRDSHYNLFLINSFS